VATDDHGLETIRKAGAEFKPGDKSNYYLQAGLVDKNTGARAFITPSGTINTAEIIRLVGGNFGTGGTLLGHDWVVATTGSAGFTIAEGELVLNTGTTANSSIAINSFRRAPFSAATFNLSHLAFALGAFDNPDLITRFGVYDPASGAGNENGLFFEFLNGDGAENAELNLVRIKNGTEEERITEAQFDGNTTPPKNNQINIWEHEYNAGAALWLVGTNLIHRSASLMDAAFGTPDLAVGMELININGNTTDNMLTTRAASISRIGVNNAIPRYFHITAAGTFVIKNSSGKLDKIVINDKGVGAAGITIYNNTAAAGTDIIGVLDSTDVQGPQPYGTNFDIGLTLEVTGGNTDITVVYE
jgi:hypothetical protein